MLKAPSQQQLIASLPKHLQPFVAVQDYSSYTPRDHAVWRFLLTQLSLDLAPNAHSTYLQGLQQTGISLDRIPKIEEINYALEQFGWRAVVVNGFLPPAIFMEFQAHKILVIAVDMRTIEHMLYTPAPDIVHESAGHAPFIIDTDYSEYLQRFGELGMKAIANKDDFAVYEAIRQLSIIKEDPNATAAAVQQAQAHLEQVLANNTEVSEAALLSRLHWWTVEYGLVGEVGNYKIFGAGLLSSLGESKSCLDDTKVKKYPLNLDAINFSYDITNTQPQLFVAKNCRHLTQVLEEFAKQMAVSVGGKSGLDKAVLAQTVNTAQLSSGIQISGQFVENMTDPMGNVIYIKTQGPTQLSYQHKQLLGHGTDFHASGFGTPVGKLQGFHRCLSDYTIDELAEKGICLDKRVTLAFVSGIKVSGMLKRIWREQHKNIVFTFSDCVVTHQSGRVLFDPSWGIFDMAVGEVVESVFGGSADVNTYPLYEASPINANLIDYPQTTIAQFVSYQQCKELREHLQNRSPQQLTQWINQVKQLTEIDWLLCYEVIELALTAGLKDFDREYWLQLMTTQAQTQQATQLCQYGLQRLAKMESQ
ncbi:aromatic amino acid hydroxylase [Paraferrimonas sp. SM1919]|uniref:aromatic amino acid hydroxylase n=1 Tax=Paraferrimonas sp. SM1919 TaxID=2662263 RepID=UPI0013D8DC12|nr:aromatic amino acid hydroxylase [Paraferrimonas sp. SM1919]